MKNQISLKQVVVSTLLLSVCLYGGFQLLKSACIENQMFAEYDPPPSPPENPDPPPPPPPEFFKI